MDMSMYVGGVKLRYPSSFQRNDSGNETTVETLGGQIYTDFRDRKRSWVVGWANMFLEDMEALRDVWASQYSSPYSYISFVFPAEGISVVAKLDISVQKPKHNGVIVENFSITLTEQHPVS